VVIPIHPIFIPEDSLNYANHSIKCDSIASAYRSALKAILYNGIDFKDERGDKMKALFNLMVTIKRPLEGLEELEKMNKTGILPYNRKFLDDYANQLIYGTMKPDLVEKEFRISIFDGKLGRVLDYFYLNDRVIKIKDVLVLSDIDLGFAYTYFERLRKRWSRLAKVTFQSFEDVKLVDSEKMDQIEEVIRLLIENPNTRRAVSTTWIPSVDLKEENCPCMNWLVFWNAKGNLNLSVGFRSHDFYGAVVENWYGLARLLEYVTLRTGLKMGSLTTISVNAHYNKLFEKDVIRICETK
jgi:thymidylate synthase (methanogen type)